MKMFFDERCLRTRTLGALLRTWKQTTDFVSISAPGISLFLDGYAIRKGEFLSLFNTLKPDQRVLFTGLLFGSGRIMDWRPSAIAGDMICQLATEIEPVQDSAVCEAYEHRKTPQPTALFGHDESSFVGLRSVNVTQQESGESGLEVPCGTTLNDIRRIALEWGCLVTEYDTALKRPPRDEETVLGRDPNRYVRVGRFERNGRRQVYRDTVTNRFLYVDNLHFGASAHLEVFDSAEYHLGIADLSGNVDASARIPGRKILW